MPDRRRSRTALAVLTFVALVLLTIDYRQEQGPVSALQRGALVVFGPLQEGFTTIVRPVGGFFLSIAELGSLRDRNAELQDELLRLQERLPSVANLERENAELRALLGMRQEVELTTTAARVIGQPPGGADFSVLIDAGANQGLEPGMAVLSAGGLVGKLTEVTGSHARVELLVSPEARYAVRIPSTGDSGLLQGQGPQPFRLEILDPEAEIRPGEQVVTRTFQASTIPEGLPVGEIVPRPPGAEFSERYRAVQPYADFTELSLVQVVLDAPRQPITLDPDEMVEDSDATRPSPPPGTEEPPATADEPPEDESGTEGT